jgi:hypothetical protein
MLRLSIAIIATVIVFAATGQTAYADDDYLVPIVVAGKTYTLTVTVGEAGISVRVGDRDVTVGEVTKVQPPELLAAQGELDARKAQAVTIPYDDLFRYNERHVGKIVRYVGKVLQVQENECLLCDNPGYVLRVAVTEDSYGFWDDPIWVEYAGTDRFLEEDTVTVWGEVTGLQKYSAVLGNQVTIPNITALDIKLGEIANPRPVGTAASLAGGAPIANRKANLRGGPGTGYPVAGSAQAGEALTIVARNSAGDWLQLDDGAWIAAFLVDNVPDQAYLLVASDISLLPTPTPQPTEASAATTPADAQGGGASTSSSIVPVGQEIEAGGWRFKVSELHKRKAVYFYDNSHIAMGHFLVVVIDATNLQSGTDYFDRNIDPWVTDEAGNVFSTSGTASSYAQWQFGGVSSLFTNVNPGNFVRIGFAVDLPDSTGRLLLSTDVGEWIDLGNFAEMQTEDN